MRWVRLFCVVVLISLIGCGGRVTNPSTGGGDQQPVGAATVEFRFVLARTVPLFVDGFRFTGRTATGVNVFGPDVRVKGSVIRLTVPTNVRTLVVEYLSGGVVVGTAEIDVTLVNGGTVIVEDPSFTDVAGVDVSGIVLEGLARLNLLRIQAGLPAVGSSASLEDGAQRHAIYMVKTNTITHFEDPAFPFFSTAGDQAARASNLAASGEINRSIGRMIDELMVSPFHGIGFIDPRLSQTGIGYFTEQRPPNTFQTAAVVHIGTLTGTPPAYPIMWPGNGQTVDLRTYPGNEQPDPLASLPGFTAPSGAPIYLQLGTGNVTPSVTAFHLRDITNNVFLTVGEFDETNYVNPDPNLQTLGRNILNLRDAIVLMPVRPLNPGPYEVSVTSNNVVFTWTFSIGEGAR